MISFLSLKEWVCVDIFKEYIKNHNITCDLTYSNKKSPLQRFYDPITKDYYIAIRTLKDNIIKVKINRYNLLVNNKYLMYSVIYDTKLRGIGIYIDKKGNIKSKIIPLRELTHLIYTNKNDELSEFLQEIDEVENSYELKFLDLVEGYNNEGIPHSCQKGRGYLLSQYKDKATLGVLIHSYSKKIVARAIIWNDGIIRDYKTDKSIGKAADLIYVYEGKYKKEMIKALQNHNIKYLYSDKLDYKSFYIKLTAREVYILEYNAISQKAAWMDTFNHLNHKERRLYSYNYKRDKTNVIRYGDDISFIFLKPDGNSIPNPFYRG
ncbi:hypothetical protein YZ82_01480 [Campylobacter hyointestinalis]|uniref:WG repeat-containing protein n=1 Tax=Campylobacter hyointestinalis TaxID=198 RepID=A0A562XKD9_CAMHY|nr:hypothetical protein [Campylobacter hyointestinalis]TWO22614.1 hypothetical protein YZ82_01480 [Campylobacter hyointestinalis]